MLVWENSNNVEKFSKRGLVISVNSHIIFAFYLTYYLCFLMPNNIQYLHNDTWKALEMKNWQFRNYSEQSVPAGISNLGAVWWGSSREALTHEPPVNCRF